MANWCGDSRKGMYKKRSTCSQTQIQIHLLLIEIGHVTLSISLTDLGACIFLHLGHLVRVSGWTKPSPRCYLSGDR